MPGAVLIFNKFQPPLLLLPHSSCPLPEDCKFLKDGAVSYLHPQWLIQDPEYSRFLSVLKELIKMMRELGCGISSALSKRAHGRVGAQWSLPVLVTSVTEAPLPGESGPQELGGHRAAGA